MHKNPLAIPFSPANKLYEQLFYEYKYMCSHLLKSNRVLEMNKYLQHGNCTCLHHCIGVSYYSYLIVNVFNIKCKQYSLVRSALLHDYFLYDWHVKDKSHSLHGFTHAKKSLNNALIDFKLNAIEKDVILRHMFPLNPVPPKTKEGIIVCLVDKMCAIYEMISKNPYQNITKELL